MDLSLEKTSINLNYSYKAWWYQDGIKNGVLKWRATRPRPILQNIWRRKGSRFADNIYVLFKALKKKGGLGQGKVIQSGQS